MPAKAPVVAKKEESSDSSDSDSMDVVIHFTTAVNGSLFTF